MSRNGARCSTTCSGVPTISGEPFQPRLWRAIPSATFLPSPSVLATTIEMPRVRSISVWSRPISLHHRCSTSPLQRRRLVDDLARRVELPAARAIAVEHPAHDQYGLVQPVEAFAVTAAEVEAESAMLGLEP